MIDAKDFIAPHFARSRDLRGWPRWLPPPRLAWTQGVPRLWSN
jgi:hypothetical protein